MTCFGNLKDIIQWHPLCWYISIYTKTSLSSKPGCSVLAGRCQQHYTPHRQPWQSSFTWLVCHHLPFVVRLCMCDGSSKEFASYVQLANKISYLWWNKDRFNINGRPFCQGSLYFHLEISRFYCILFFITDIKDWFQDCFSRLRIPPMLTLLTFQDPTLPENWNIQNFGIFRRSKNQGDKNIAWCRWLAIICL